MSIELLDDRKNTPDEIRTDWPQVYNVKAKSLTVDLIKTTDS